MQGLSAAAAAENYFTPTVSSPEGPGFRFVANNCSSRGLEGLLQCRAQVATDLGIELPLSEGTERELDLIARLLCDPEGRDETAPVAGGLRAARPAGAYAGAALGPASCALPDRELASTTTNDEVYFAALGCCAPA